MHADGVDVFDKANGNLVVVGITDNFKLKLFPAEDTFLDKNLTYKRCLQASFAYNLKFVYIINHSATGTAHCIGRTKNNRVLEFLGYLDSFINRVSNFTSRHTDTEILHCILELDTVFTTFDSVDLNADYLYVELFQYTCLVKLRAEIKS